VGSVIAIIGEEGDNLSGAEQLATQASEQEPPKEEKTPEPPRPTEETASKPSHMQPQEAPRPEPPKGDRIFASPIAKKIALERGIPLAQIKGSGPNGRIIREDVEGYKPAQATSATAQPSAAQLPDYIDTPVTNMRRTIGARLTQSKQEIPHYYLTVDIHMDKVLKLREVFNKSLSEKDKSAKLSVNDFIVKAVSCALSDVPEANSAWLGEVIRTSVIISFNNSNAD
jgi:pyruvate dehydrogenase E2 component (dihydrolipoamide acetyltransferase)